MISLFSEGFLLGMIRPSKHLQIFSTCCVPGKVLDPGHCADWTFLRGRVVVGGLQGTDTTEFTLSNGSLLWKEG